MLGHGSGEEDEGIEGNNFGGGGVDDDDDGHDGHCDGGVDGAAMDVSTGGLKDLERALSEQEAEWSSYWCVSISCLNMPSSSYIHVLANAHARIHKHEHVFCLQIILHMHAQSIHDNARG